jgi:MFS transporter, ACDE family, multidrug resistance protein
LIAPGLPDILDAFDAPRGLAGVILASATFPGIVLAPMVGFLADRYGRREVLVPCLTVFAVAGGMAAFAPSLWVLVVLRLIQGAGSAGLINLATVLIGDHWDGPERARVIGRNAAVLTVSVAVFPALGGGLTDLGGWQAPFLLYPLSLVTAWAVFRRIPPTRSRHPGSVRQQLSEVTPLLRTTNFMGIAVSGVLVFILLFGLLQTALPIYLEAEFGLSAGLRGIMLGSPAVGAAHRAKSLGRVGGRGGGGQRRLARVV